MPEPRSVDTLIHNAYVVTMDRDRRVFTDGWLAFDGGRIVGVGSMGGSSMDRAPTDGAWTDEARPDGAPTDGTRANEAWADEAGGDRSRADRAQAEGAPSDGARADGVQTDRVPTHGARMGDCGFVGRRSIDARGRMVIPGIANAHNHLVQNAFRGYNDDRWPVLDIPAAVVALLHQLQALTARLDAERAFILTRAHTLDLLRSGYTATHDEHFTNIRKDSADGSWAAVEASGLRGFLCRCIVNADRMAADGRETVEKGLQEAERLRARFASDRIEVATGFLNFQFLNDAGDMRRIVDGAAAMAMRVDVDMTDNSRGAALRARGFEGGQVDYYARHGLLDQPLYAGKAVSILPHEYGLLAQADARVALVPMLRFFDGTGLHIHDFLAQGMMPGIGTDAPLVSDCQSPFEAMRMAILAQNIAVKRDKAAGLPPPDPAHWAVAETMLEMATLGGARALFLDDRTGSLAVGKAADCVMLDLSRATTGPGADRRRDIGTVVWAGSTVNVDSVFVAGEALLEQGRSTRWDEEAVMAEARDVMSALIAEAGLDGLLPPRVPGRRFRGWTYQ
ncbi:amidohydrolase family protein [Sphingobium sufflavum]|uniref:amidohydrolase family protein n=1 Tax=Sphingobium sufflavum TaxID=1129547 RepID=UPI001F21EFB5|nr:amidohydrolase family protein [Sphingobium sufflavum]MCE7796253.1 amidohydrolase family protein [Sphingobium sufflavum]